MKVTTGTSCKQVPGKYKYMLWKHAKKARYCQKINTIQYPHFHNGTYVHVRIQIYMN